MKKVLKVIMLTILILLLLASFASCCLYGYLKLFTPEKSVSITVKGGTLEGVEDENLKFIFNIRSFNNMFEIRLNSFIDETKEEVYGTGIQFFNPSFSTYTSQTESFIYTTEYFAIPWYVYNTYEDNSYALETFAPQETTIAEAIEQANMLYKNAYFTVTIGEDIFKFTFKNELVKTGENHLFLGWYDYFYYRSNFMKLCYDLYESSKSFKEGINQTYLFDFSQYLNFQKYDKDKKQYTDILNEKSEDYALVTKHMKAFFGVKVDCYKRDVQKATESLFNSVKGLYTYNITNNTISSDYFVGQDIISLSELDFEFKIDNNVGYYIVLKDSVKNYYSKFNNILLDINLNMTYLNECGVSTFAIDKSKLNLGDLKVYKITKNYYDSEGNLSESEVAYVE